MLTCLNRSMKILVVGAGAVGDYFGGRLLEVGREVTFLVRPRRAAQLAKSGLVIKSPAGDVTVPAPKTVAAAALHHAFDLAVLQLLEGSKGACNNRMYQLSIPNIDRIKACSGTVSPSAENPNA